MRYGKAMAFAASFYLLIYTILYPPLNIASDLAGSLKNQDGFDPVRTGAYRNVFIAFTGAFSLMLYVCIIDLIQGAQTLIM